MSTERTLSPATNSSATTSLPPVELNEKPDLERQDTKNLDQRETHARHLYEGFPDYALTQGSSEVSLGLSPIRSRVTDPRSPATRVALRRRNATEQFSHPLADLKTDEALLVDFDGPDDDFRPVNWTFRKKAWTTFLYALTTMGATWGSSIYSTAIPSISRQFQVADVVSTLGITLYLFGFGTGPMIWAPLSEVYGRRPAVFIPYFIGICFVFGSATAKDFQTLMLTRFFTGFFSSAPVTNTGGVLGDLWTPAQRGPAMAGYSMAVAGGPLIAPIVGGAIIDSYLSWRWTEYTTGILMGLVLLMNVIFIDESYTPVLLVYKARRLRHETNNWALHAKHEEWDVSISSLATKYMVRPFQLLFTPITACMTAYASFVYGILYLSFASFPIIFQEIRGWNALVGALPFLGVLIGCVIGAGMNSLNTSYYMKRLKANNNRPVPEARLPPMMVGAVLFPAGCFLLGWTSSKDIFWLCPCIGAVLIGAGFLAIFQCALNYLIDTFQMYAASASACNTAMRSLLAGVFPLFAVPMFHGLGVGWASSLIGFVAIAMIPIPFLFFYYGHDIRARGKWSKPSTE